jgi:hypothetical protein
MRRVYLLGVVAALAVLAAAVFSASAGARTESRFSVVADPTHGHAHANAFHLRGRLRDPGDLDDIVGHFRATFKRGGHFRGIFNFGNGKLKANGDQARHRVPVVGGSGVWNGAAGKLKVHNLSHNRALLTFVVVQ